MFLTIFVFLTSGFALFGPIEVPDGKGGLLTFARVENSSECIDDPIVVDGITIVLSPDKGRFGYFCQV